ncbi:MAG: hypothetical protein JWO30_1369 [Fibrobacteres bacterium]|nr:hypothetical protein [Fibrobacterota bacterium]
MADENENNLVQRAREDRRTLEKMRRKLATSGHMGKNDVAKLKSAKRGIRIWPIAAAAAVLLIGLNFALRGPDDHAIAAIAGKNGHKAPLAPPATANLDEQARFWAYAIYDIAKLKSHFTIPKGSVIDPAAARQNLERLLAENLGNEVRKEIFTFQQNAPQAPEGKKIGAARKPTE